MCKCRRIELTNHGQKLRGMVYCEECVRDKGPGVLALKQLMAAELQSNIDKIKKRIRVVQAVQPDNNFN